MNNNVKPIPTIRIYVEGGCVQNVEVLDGSFDFRLDVEIVEDDYNWAEGNTYGEVTDTYCLNDYTNNPDLAIGTQIETPLGVGVCCDVGRAVDGSPLFGFRLVGAPSTRTEWFSLRELGLQ